MLTVELSSNVVLDAVVANDDDDDDDDAVDVVVVAADTVDDGTVFESAVVASFAALCSDIVTRVHS